MFKLSYSAYIYIYNTSYFIKIQMCWRQVKGNFCNRTISSGKNIQKGDIGHFNIVTYFRSE